MASKGERGLSRILEKLEASVVSGQYYEAHQMYRTLYFRYLAQKKYSDLLDLLYKGSTLLLKSDQQGSGVDLAILLIEVLNKSETKPSQEWIEKIVTLFEKINPGIVERETFITNAVKWSMDDSKKGHPLLHKKIAEIFWKEEKFTSAHRHFLHSSDGATYANMLIELHTTKGLKSEVDLFIAQAVLRCLCLRNIEMAAETFNKYVGSHPTIKNSKGPPYKFPLLNFLWFLLRVIPKKNKVQFLKLRNVYAPSLKRDLNFSIYLNKIGYIWFGIEVPQNTNPSFGDLIKSIIGDVDLDTSDGERECARKNVVVPELD